MPRPEIHSVLDQYRHLEARAASLIQGVCGQLCRNCAATCCRVGICREALQSPFLRAVQGTSADFDVRLGFRDCNGCTLQAGRPPVCHAYLCHRILAGQPDDARRYAIECLGDLVGFMGAGVWRGRHLVEALTDSDLHASNMAVFLSRMMTAATALGLLDAALNHGAKLNARELGVLALIRKP
jgi:hypothetical protein